MRALSYLLLFGMAGPLLSPSAAAQTEHTACKIYFVDDRLTPPSVKALLEMHGDAAARVCSPDTENVSYAAISAVWKGARGACIFQQGPVSYLKLNEQAGPYTTFMALARADCPKQDDRSYKSAEGVSEGVFVALINFVERISASRANFDAELVLSQRDQSIGEARAGILASEPRARLTLSAIRLQPPDIHFSQSTTADYAYVLEFADDSTRRGWQLIVDLTPRGFKIVQISPWFLYDNIVQ